LAPILLMKMFMTDEKTEKRGALRLPPWIIIGAVVILVPIFVFWAFQNITREKRFTTELMLEKGAALIRSFEAGTRTGMMGMMGMHGGGFQLQNLLMETAQQPDILYLAVTDINGTILAHSDPSRIGGVYGRDQDLRRIAGTKKVEWRQILNPEGAGTFEVFRRFLPTSRGFKGLHGRMMHNMFPGAGPDPAVEEAAAPHIIFVGLDMGPIVAARQADTRHTVIMALILLLIGFAGIVTLFLAQAYRSARTSLTRIRAFSDTLVENMPIGLLALDKDETIVSFNQTAEAILQLSSTEVLGQKAREILPQQIECLSKMIDTDSEVLEEEIACPVEEGRTIPMDVSASRLRGDDGNLLGYIILFRDLSEIQELKREIERNQRLASLGRLAAGVAHEIRNPLSSIKGFATYFKERYREIPEDKKTAEIMVQEVDRLNRVIGQLLEFARPMTVRKKSTSLQTLIQHALKMVEREARGKDIHIEAALSTEIRDVRLDPDRMNQVFLNLCFNAIEAMANGGTLAIGLSRKYDSDRIQIDISDTGCGISKEDLVRIFDPYFTTKQSGTGLGLAIVHKIVESHGGEVKVASEPGKGTTVTLLLPAS